VLLVIVPDDYGSRKILPYDLQKAKVVIRVESVAVSQQVCKDAFRKYMCKEARHSATLLPVVASRPIFKGLP